MENKKLKINNNLYSNYYNIKKFPNNIHLIRPKDLIKYKNFNYNNKHNHSNKKRNNSTINNNNNEEESTFYTTYNIKEKKINENEIKKRNKRKKEIIDIIQKTLAHLSLIKLYLINENNNEVHDNNNNNNNNKNNNKIDYNKYKIEVNQSLNLSPEILKENKKKNNINTYNDLKKINKNKQKIIYFPLNKKNTLKISHFKENF